MKTLKVGVFGVGSLGQLHARIYAQLDGAELVGVCDLDRARAEDIAALHDTQAYTDPDALAAQLDAASLVVPTDLHASMFQRLAEHNLHVLVEKPIASSTREAEDMVALARAKDLVLQVGHIERFNPVMQFLEDNLSRPRFIEATRLAPFPPLQPGRTPRGTEVSVVLDLMIHDLEIILHLVGAPVKRINAAGVAVLSNSEDIANVRLGFENGCLANVTASRVSREKTRKIRIFQEDTYLSLDYMNQSGQLCRKVPDGIDALPVPIDREEPLLAELRSFVQCVQTRGQPVVSGAHASKALTLAVEICRHIRECPS
jgi:predicted dehydrogenase